MSCLISPLFSYYLICPLFMPCSSDTILYTAENDEWILGEITDLNQQISSLVLPQYRMPLSLRRRGNFVVSAPFYTSDQGDRMRALVYPRNDSDKW